MKLAIIGKENMVFPLRSIGADIIDFNTKEEGEKFFAALREPGTESEYCVIFITPDWSKKLEKDIAKLKNRALPAIIFLPSLIEKKDEGGGYIEKLMETATGSRLNLK